MKLLIIFIIFFSYNSYAKRDCINDLENYDICNFAKKIMSEFKEKIPFKVSLNVTITSVYYSNKKIFITAQLSYNKDFLLNTIEKSSTPVTYKEIIEDMTGYQIHYYCNNGSTSYFLDIGGLVTLRYLYKDGSEVYHFTIDKHSC